MAERQHPMNEIIQREAQRVSDMEKEARHAMRTSPAPGMQRTTPAQFMREYLAGRIPPETVTEVMKESYATNDDPTGVFGFMEDARKQTDA